MQTKELMELLDRFLEHPEKRVLILKGDWGVGKTYFWKEYIKSRMASVQEDAVAYVSLFGASSLSDVENQIISSSDPTSKKSAQEIIRWAWCYIRKGASYALRYSAELSKFLKLHPRPFINNFLVCLDDFERRKHRHLPIEEVLGLVAFLKEREKGKRSRLVLILNEDQLTKRDRKGLEKYREKTVDIEVVYDPLIAANASIVFSGCAGCGFYTGIFERLNVNNIRVMKQCAWNLDAFEDHLGGLEKALLEQIREHIVIITCFYHMKGKFGADINTLSDVRSYTKGFNLATATEVEQRISDLTYDFTKYGYHYAEYDDQIIKYVQERACDVAEFRKRVDELNAREKQNQIMQHLQGLWNLYGENFVANEEEIVSLFREFMDANADRISEREFFEVEKFLSQLGADTDESIAEWRERMLRARVDKMNLANLASYEEEVSDNAALLELISRRRKELKGSRSIKETLYKVVCEHGWNPEDEMFLASTSVEDFYSWIKGETDKDLVRCLGSFVGTFERMSDRPQMHSAAKKVISALQRIGRENVLNRMRVESVLKIRVDDEPEGSGADSRPGGS